MQTSTHEGGSTRGPASASGARFLRTFAIMVAVVAVAVGTINVLAFRYMLREDNQSIVQLLAGWGRTYKPVLYDRFEPEVAVFGASWARDAFDPIEVGKLLGRKVFNHAVSGGTAYETRRFADSALTNPNLRAAIINLDTIYGAEDARTKYGFDEAVLNFNPDLTPNRWVALSRAYSLVFTGWAIGADLDVLTAVRARERGAPPSEYLASYEQADLTTRREQLEAARARVLPESSPTVGRAPEVSAGQGPLEDPSPFQVAALAELELMIDRLCERGVDVYLYFTPRNMFEQNCDPDAQLARYTLELARRKQAMCAAKIGYFDFAYPNAVTLEGVTAPVTQSVYYRPDGHPRPTVGILMAAQMFGVDVSAESEDVQRDFGVDLLRDPNPEAWLRERAARCVGVWAGGEPSSNAAR
jgi:hypothetical protein